MTASLDDKMHKPSVLAAPFARREETLAWQKLMESERDTLSAISEMVVFAPHTVLYTMGSTADYVYNIVDGAVATYEYFMDGTKSISAFLFPQDLVGLSENGCYVATAETLNQVRAFKISLHHLAALLRKDAKLSVGLLLKVCHDLRNAQRHAIVVSHNIAHRRVASFLLWLDDALHRRSVDDAQPLLLASSILLPMTRHDIADYLGLSVESISRALQLLEVEGAIQRAGPRGIDIVDRNKLMVLSARQ